jgi:glycosyltransferase involved in cell wall biosynthesis
MRIIHLPVASAGQPDQFARGLRRCNLHARSLQVTRHNFSYGADIVLEGLARPTVVAETLTALCRDFDVFHFHRRPLLYKKTLLFPNGMDLFALKLAGKKVFFHFRGSEIRLSSVFAEMCPYHYVEDSEDKVGTLPARFNEADQRTFRDLVSVICDGVFVTDPELQSYVPDATIVPRLKCFEDLPPAPPGRRQRPLIVHAPSSRGAKGSNRVVEVLNNLTQRGIEFDFKLVEGLPHQEALAVYREADIVIDQLRIGWYGVTAVEGMALGKAVVTYIRDDLKHYLPLPCPFALANPETLEGVLADLILDPKRVTALGAEGRRFAEHYHCAERICRVLSTLYAQPPREVVPADVLLLGVQSEVNYSDSIKKRLSGVYKDRYQKQFAEKLIKNKKRLISVYKDRYQERFIERFTRKEANVSKARRGDQSQPQNIWLWRRALRSILYRSRTFFAKIR